jgi:hypothetical protein
MAEAFSLASAFFVPDTLIFTEPGQGGKFSYIAIKGQNY